MKAKDIKEYEEYDYCMSRGFEVNGVEYEDIPKEEKLELINDMLENDVNSESILYEMFKIVLENLQIPLVEGDSSVCEQCGHYNIMNRYKLEQ